MSFSASAAGLDAAFIAFSAPPACTQQMVEMHAQAMGAIILFMILTNAVLLLSGHADGRDLVSLSG